MTNFAGSSMDEQLKKLLEENIEYSKEIYRLSLQVKKYILWGRVMTAIQLLFIVVPIILGVIYLPALLGGFFSSLGGGLPGAASSAGAGGFEGMFKQYQEILNIYK